MFTTASSPTSTRHRMSPLVASAASRAAPMTTRTRLPFASTVRAPISRDGASTRNEPPSARVDGASSDENERTVSNTSSGSRGARHKASKASVMSTTTSSWSAADDANGPIAPAAASDRAARDRATSRFTATPFNAPLSSCAVRAPICCSTSNHSSSTERMDPVPPSAELVTALSSTILFARLGVVRRRGHRDCRFARYRTMLQRRLHIPRDSRRCSTHGELVEEKSEFLVVGGREGCLHGVRQVPEATLERTERLLSGLVEELLIRIGRLPLVLGILAKPAVDLVPERRRHVLEQHVLEVRREVNFRRLALRKIMKC